MFLRKFLSFVALAGLISAARATIISHDNLADFQTGIPSGSAAIVLDRNVAATGSPNASVGIMPPAGAILLSDDLSYTDPAAAEAAGWRFVLPNAQPATPSTYSVTDNPGFVRLNVSRPQDFHDTSNVAQQSPVLFINNQPITGDFIAEAKLTIVGTRQANRIHGLIVMPYSGDPANPVTVDAQSSYFYTGTYSTNQLVTSARPATDYGPTEVTSGTFASSTWTVRIVKIGAYLYSYLRDSDTGPWVFHQWLKMSRMVPDASAPLVVGAVAKSWGTTADIQSVDYDYFRVWRLGPDAGNLSGTYTNVIDAGAPVDWQVAYPWGISMQGMKYQLRTGNTLANGTLADPDNPFVGPDNTSATYFEDDVAAKVPNPNGKRYLEYKVTLDQNLETYPGQQAPNLPAVLLRFSGVFQPAGLTSELASSAAELGTGTGAGVQPNTGDVSLARTVVFRDDFDSTTLDPGWTFDNRRAFLDPTAIGDYSLTERPGFFRMKVGYIQDLYAGSGNKYGGVTLMRNLPVDPSNVEIETEVNMEEQQSRMAVLMLWQDENNWVGLGMARRFGTSYSAGAVGDVVLNDVGGSAQTNFYGSNRTQLRVTKVGRYVTLACRDTASPSPSWRVLDVVDAGENFVPTQAGFIGKSYRDADRPDTGAVNYDYDYFQVSTLATTGTQTIPITLPAGSRPDVALLFADAEDPGSVKARIRDASGNFVGPDGTGATYFTSNEPKLPASLAGITSTALELTLDATRLTGVPYVHAAGIQHVTGSTQLARDTNAADFAAATVKNNVDLTTTPGLARPTIGAPQRDDFAAAPSDWLWANTPPGTSSYSFTDNPGFARLRVASGTNLWSGGTSDTKPRAILYKNALFTGDFEAETHITMSARTERRHYGIAVIQANPAGTTPDNKLDLTNVVVVGPYRLGDIRLMRGDNDAFNDATSVSGQTGTDYYLRLRKIGRTFTGSFSTDGVNWTGLSPYTFTHDVNSVYIGFSGKHWSTASTVPDVDFDYLKVSPLITGTLESRVLDLGAADTSVAMNSMGGNSAGALIQFRAANTPDALAALPYVGPDGTAATSYAGNALDTVAGLKGRYFQYKATLPPGTTLNDIALYSLPISSVPLTRDDAITALKIAAGLQNSAPTDLDRLDVVKGASAGYIDLTDATQILRTVSGL